MEPSKPRREDSLDHDPGTAFGMDDGGELGLMNAAKSTWTEFRTLDYNYLLPISKFLSASLFRKKAVRWVLLFGLMPLVFFQIHQWLNLTFEQAIWLIEIYFCLFWALYFYSIIRPPSSVWRRAIGYAFFTAFIGIPMLLASQKLPVIRDLYAGIDSYDFWTQAAGFILGVGILEETCKALPLLWFGLRNNKIVGVRDGVFLGLMSGFGFAAAEGVQYTIRATVSAQMYGSFTEQFMQFIFRIMTGPILHGAWAGTVGWFIGLAAARSGKKWPTIVIGIGVMALLHGLYDVYAGQLIGIGLAGMTFAIFMAYLSHGEEQSTIPTPEPVAADTPEIAPEANPND